MGLEKAVMSVAFLYDPVVQQMKHEYLAMCDENERLKQATEHINEWNEKES